MALASAMETGASRALVKMHRELREKAGGGGEKKEEEEKKKDFCLCRKDVEMSVEYKRICGEKITG